MAEWHRASAAGAVDLSLIPSRVKPMTSNLVFTPSLLDVQHQRDSVENKPASSLVVPLGMALSGISRGIGAKFFRLLFSRYTNFENSQHLSKLAKF